jgi:hypothetical protein
MSPVLQATRQRIDLDAGDVGIVRQIIAGVETGRRVATLVPAELIE